MVRNVPGLLSTNVTKAPIVLATRFVHLKQLALHLLLAHVCPHRAGSSIETWAKRTLLLERSGTKVFTSASTSSGQNQGCNKLSAQPCHRVPGLAASVRTNYEAERAGAQVSIQVRVGSSPVTVGEVARSLWRPARMGRHAVTVYVLPEMEASGDYTVRLNSCQ